MNDTDLYADRAVQQAMARAVQLGYIVEFVRSRGSDRRVDLLALNHRLLDRREAVQPATITATIGELLQDRTAAGELARGRWGTPHETYHWQQCRYCGVAGRDHPRTVCRACDIPQCLVADECNVCLHGYLDGMSYGHHDGSKTRCGYTGCGNDAVATAHRVKQVCREHLNKPTRRFRGKTITLLEDITQHVAMLGQRRTHSGQGWYRQTVWYPN